MAAASNTPTGSVSLRRGALPSLAGCALAVLAVQASTGAPGGLPPAVAAAIAESDATCAGTVHVDRTFVTRQDVNADGVPDYIVNYRGWRCGGAPPGFCGSAGCLVQVFVSRPGGGFAKVFDENAALSFPKVRGRPAMRVVEAGGACGRPANVLPCIAVRLWNGRTFVGPWKDGRSTGGAAVAPPA